MRPEPRPAAGSLDEVGMVIGNAEVVNLRVAARRADGADRHALARVQAGVAIAGRQVTRRRLALAFDEERML